MSLLSEVAATVIDGIQLVTTENLETANLTVGDVMVNDVSVTGLVETLNLTATGTTELYNTNIYGLLQFENHIKITNGQESDNNVSIGYSVGPGNYTGMAVNNVVLGNSAGSALTDGIQNVCVGFNAGSQITVDSNNVAIGTNSLASTPVGSGNVAIGSFAGYVEIGNSNIAIGDGAMNSDVAVVGNNNICIGTDSGNTEMADGNILLGVNSSMDNTGLSNTIAFGNSSYASQSNTINIARNTQGAAIYNFLVLGNVTAGNSSLIPGSYANDVQAAAGSVPLGGVYRNGNVLQIRLT